MIDLSRFKSEELEDWQENEITLAVLKQLQSYRLARLWHLEDVVAAGDRPYYAASIGGETSAIRKILKDLNNGKAEE